MNMIEESKMADPRFSRVLAIARQLGMSLDALAHGASPPTPRQTTWAEGTRGICMAASGSEASIKIAWLSEAIRSVAGAGGGIPLRVKTRAARSPTGKP
jgi:hypothetical protein